MGTVTLTKHNRLFWLGRYLERAYAGITATRPLFEADTDGREGDYADYCRRVGIPDTYKNTADFVRRFYFYDNDPNSIASALGYAYDNAIVLRETLSTDTLAYVQMAISAMELAAASAAPGVELQWVLDDIMAFRGSFDDSVEVETAHRQQRRLRLLCQCALFGHFYPRRGPRLPCGAGAGTGSRGGPPDGGDLRDAEKSGVGAAVHSAGIPRGV